jgi:ElaB/YqjD/DUF883 family membrane-anchored ribosome-binding protein
MRDLLDGLEGILQRIDQLVHSAAKDADGKAGEAGEEVSASLSEARERLEEVERDLQQTLKRAATEAGRYVEDHPWPAIALAAAAGFAVGVLLASRRK